MNSFRRGWTGVAAILLFIAGLAAGHTVSSGRLSTRVLVERMEPGESSGGVTYIRSAKVNDACSAFLFSSEEGKLVEVVACLRNRHGFYIPGKDVIGANYTLSTDETDFNFEYFFVFDEGNGAYALDPSVRSKALELLFFSGEKAANFRTS